MTKYIKLDGDQFTALHEAMTELFSADSLGLMLRQRLNRQLGSITPMMATPYLVQNVIEDAERRGWVDDLVLACSEARPGFPPFEKLVYELSLGVQVEEEQREALERFYKDEGSLLDWAVLGGLIKKVCQISYKTNVGNTVNGTGFLVGPDIIMTNYHVMEKIIDPEQTAAGFGDVVVKFDYKLNEDGSTLNSGASYHLAGDPLIHSSKYADSDLLASDTAPSTRDDELDFALLRLEKPVGCLPVRSKAGTDLVADDSNRRGWVPIEANPLLPDIDAPITIVQHPAGGVVKIAHAPRSVIEHNPGKTRTRHRTATLGGSSGSPCFDVRWRLVGLHNGTDPDLARPATYNQFVPIRAIRALLEREGKLGLLGQPCE